MAVIDDTGRRLASNDIDSLWRMYYNQSNMSGMNPRQVEQYRAVFMTGIALFMNMDNSVAKQLMRSEYQRKWDTWATEINEIFKKLEIKAGIQN